MSDDVQALVAEVLRLDAIRRSAEPMLSSDFVALARHAGPLAREVQRLTAERDEARALLRECADMLERCSYGYVDSEHYEAVRELGERVGYGVVMCCASHAWSQKCPQGGAFQVAPPGATVVALRNRLAAAEAVPPEWQEDDDE